MVVLLTGLLSGCLVTKGPPPLAAGPRVFVGGPVHDFGTVAIGDEVRHVFPVENRGRQPLVLEPGQMECGCSAVVSAGGTLGAGETGWIEVAFDTTGAPGERVRTVTLQTNDVDSAELVLTLRGTVEAEVRAEPDRVFFGRVPQGASREIMVEIETAPDVSVRKVLQSSRRIDVRFSRMKPPRSGIRLEVKLLPQRQRGSFDDEIRVTTTSELQPEISIPVFGFVE